VTASKISAPPDGSVMLSAAKVITKTCQKFNFQPNKHDEYPFSGNALGGRMCPTQIVTASRARCRPRLHYTEHGLRDAHTLWPRPRQGWKTTRGSSTQWSRCRVLKMLLRTLPLVHDQCDSCASRVPWPLRRWAITVQSLRTLIHFKAVTLLRTAFRGGTPTKIQSPRRTLNMNSKHC
jgi:hypothetical protein